MKPFSSETFAYLDKAKKHQKKLPWFEKNRSLYEDEVRRPMADLIAKLWADFQDEIPKLKISPKRISRPTRPVRAVPTEKPLVKPEISFYFAEPATSRFEWNPGIFFELSAEEDGNVLKVGLYDLISSRQTKIMRREITGDFDTFDSILSNPKLKKRFGGLQGETYKRYPRQLDENDPAATYLRFKQFYLSRTYTRAEVESKNFAKTFSSDLALALPFLKWILAKVPLYEKQERLSFSERDELD